MNDYEWVYNTVSDGAVVRDMTAHVVSTAADENVRTQCGLELPADDDERTTVKEEMPDEERRCGNCPWGEVERALNAVEGCEVCNAHVLKIGGMCILHYVANNHTVEEFEQAKAEVNNA